MQIAGTNGASKHQKWKRCDEWRFPASLCNCNKDLGSAQQSPLLLALPKDLGPSRHCCWRFHRQLSKSENAADNGVSVATCLVQLEGAIRIGAMHGQLREKGHPLGNTFRRTLVWEILSKRIPNREMCLHWYASDWHFLLCCPSQILTRCYVNILVNVHILLVAKCNW